MQDAIVANISQALIADIQKIRGWDVNQASYWIRLFPSIEKVPPETLQCIAEKVFTETQAAVVWKGRDAMIML